jgi:LysM repeat protein
VFPSQYAAYVERLTARAVRGSASSPSVYTVRPGDTLWDIARRHGTSTRALRRTNELSSTRIYPGQSLRVPESH